MSTRSIAAISGNASYQSVLATAQIPQARLVVVALPDAGAIRTAVREARRASASLPFLVRSTRVQDEEMLKRNG